MKATVRALKVGRSSGFAWGMRYAAGATAAVMITCLVVASAASAQVAGGAPLPVMTPPPAGVQPPATFPGAELDRIVSPIALYPDPLLAQVLTASTFAPQIPLAAQWVDSHRGLNGEQLVSALSNEQVTWDPSVQALVAFPTVLQMMASSMPWTTEVGEAFQSQHGDVMDAVQRLRVQAQRYGYLQSNAQYRVTQAPVIEIVPVNPAYVVVPYYDPIVVFAPPRTRYLASTAIYLGYGVQLGMWYEPWGWRSSGFYWPAHRVVAVYPGWQGPWNYREPSRPYHYGPSRGGERDGEWPSRGGERDGGRVAVTPHGYTDPRYAAHGTAGDQPRTAHDSDVRRGGFGAATPSSGGDPRMAQPRSGHDVQQPPTPRPEAQPGVRSSPPRVDVQPPPRSNGDGGQHTGRTAKARA